MSRGSEEESARSSTAAQEWSEEQLWPKTSSEKEPCLRRGGKRLIAMVGGSGGVRRNDGFVTPLRHIVLTGTTEDNVAARDLRLGKSQVHCST